MRINYNGDSPSKYISRLELAKISPTIDTADKIANALKIKLSELISHAEK